MRTTVADGLRQTNELKSECKILNYWSKFPGRQVRNILPIFIPLT